MLSISQIIALGFGEVLYFNWN